MVLLVEQYLTENYDMRFNQLSKKIEVRAHGEADFRPVTEKLRNSIIRRIKIDMPEVTNVKQNVVEYLDSEDIVLYDPIRDYLASLPEWDGCNRVAELFGQLPGVTSEHIYWLNIWMRSAVVHWLGMDTLHANEIVPTLIGPQGCGKSTFCQRLLPPSLRVYFLDHFNMANKFDKEMALTNNLLINLDELDQFKPGQQAELKQSISKVKVNGRPIFGRAQDDRMRYASFVATTNNPHPLQDPTGSRRYVCITIPEGCIIDNTFDINYDQFYAQLMYEVKEKKMRYWLTTEESHTLQAANAQYQSEQDLASILSHCFRKPDGDEPATEYTVQQIVDILRQQFPAIQKSHALSIHVGLELKHAGIKPRQVMGYNRYRVVPLIKSHR